MNADETKTEAPAATNQPSAPAQPPKASNPAAVKKAVALGKEIRKQSEKTKADAAREMYALIYGEPREIIIQALIDGAGSARDDTVKVLRRIAHAMVVGSPYGRTDVLPATS
jgi:hypothetical protein